MDIYLDIEQLKMFAAIVIAGSVYGQYLFHKGKKHGWDSAMYELNDAGIVRVDDDGEIHRVSDHEFKKFKQSLHYGE